MDNINKISCLVVNNSKNDIEACTSILQEHVKTIYVASNGQEGLEVFLRESPDMVISDIDIPIMNGLDMSIAIRDVNPSQLILIVSEFTNKEHLLKAIDIGIDKFILKPIKDINELLNAISTFADNIMTRNSIKEKNFLIEQKDKIINKHVLSTTYDTDGNIIDASKAYLDMIGYTVDEVLGKVRSGFKSILQEKSNDDLWKTITDNKPWHGELKNYKKNGQTVWHKVLVEPIYDHTGIKVGYSAIKEDVTEKNNLKELTIRDELTNLHNRRYFEYFMKNNLVKKSSKNKTLALLMIDVDYFKKYNDLYGHAKGDMALISIAKTISSNIGHEVDAAFRIGGEEFAIVILNKSDDEIKEYAQKLNDDIKELNIEHNNSEVSKYITLSTGIVNLELSSVEYCIDEVYNIADENLYIAKNNGRNKYVFTNNKSSLVGFKNIDTVSKLKNREHLINDLDLLHSEAMLIILHVNQISEIESVYGAEITAEILVKKTNELKRIVVNGEATLFKLNMKEFAILITDNSKFDKYLSIVKYSLIDRVFYEEFKDTNITSSFTAGIAYGITDLFHKSDTALKKAIDNNKNYFLYDEKLDEKNINHSTMKDLKIYREALDEGNIVPFFQPIVDSHNGDVLKYEALARIITDDGEIISPYSFLKASKDDDSFEFFTRQVMQKVFNVYAKKHIPISINITYENLISNSMVNYIINRLDTYGGDNITFEIVESEDIKDYKVVEDFILIIKKYGCKVSIDDFGTGYSNFSQLIKLNLDYIKLDGSLIEKINDDENIQNMLRALVKFAKDIQLETIAEYVSSKEIAQTLKEFGIDYFQGYYYGEPKSPESYNLI